ncbi:guanine nucleotide exchange factor [Nemania sp. FL0916]|nr:guanine nucleotide exchange factor [Nemania sp. FL0916]
MVQAPPITEMSVEGSLPAKATELVRSADADDQFLAARLLLLCAAHPTVDFPSDFELETLAQALNAATARHASTGETEPTKACTAILQLISVLAAKHEAAAHHLLVSLDPVLRMFDRAPIRDPPLQPPMSLLIDCLAALVSHDDPLATSEISWPPFNEEKLVNVLALAIQAYQPDSVERQITPLASLLFKISRSAPSDTKERLRAHLLPSDQDRTQALGRGHSLPHKLVKISTEAVSSVLKEVMAHLFLELSDGDPKRLVHNVGFGCAVGLLYTLGIPAPPDDSDGSQSAGHPCEINPVTGQRRDMETQPSLPEMTDAEKEREAERLVRLV